MSRMREVKWRSWSWTEFVVPEKRVSRTALTVLKLLPQDWLLSSEKVTRGRETEIRESSSATGVASRRYLNEASDLYEQLGKGSA